MKTIEYFLQLLFIPHFFFFIFSKRKDIIKKDILANILDNKNVEFINLTSLLLKNKYFRTLFYFRLNTNLSKLLRIFYPQHSCFTIDINSKIGAGLKLAHPFATIINANVIGDNLYINHLVTIGEKNNKKPKIGNNVQIHANVIIIGGITIGDNVIIGAGSVIVKNIPDNSVVIGNPAKIIKQND